MRLRLYTLIFSVQQQFNIVFTLLSLKKWGNWLQFPNMMLPSILLAALLPFFYFFLFSLSLASSGNSFTFDSQHSNSIICLPHKLNEIITSKGRVRVSLSPLCSWIIIVIIIIYYCSTNYAGDQMMFSSKAAMRSLCMFMSIWLVCASLRRRSCSR